ncbi:hypothetical protein Droror1_Dr00027327 [Drosera rotundifolia]
MATDDSGGGDVGEDFGWRISQVFDEEHVPAWQGNDTPNLFKYRARFAISEYNKKNEPKLEFVKVVSVFQRTLNNNFIAIEAKEYGAGDGETTRTYQAMIENSEPGFQACSEKSLTYTPECVPEPASDRVRT